MEINSKIRNKHWEIRNIEKN